MFLVLLLPVDYINGKNEKLCFALLGGTFSHKKTRFEKFLYGCFVRKVQFLKNRNLVKTLKSFVKNSPMTKYCHKVHSCVATQSVFSILTWKET